MDISFSDYSGSEFVEAIEEGKIIKVPLEYARKEGLLILKKLGKQNIEKDKKQEEVEQRLSFEDFRKPLNWRKNQVYSELIDNWQWEISKKRRSLGMTRKQLASKIGESENVIKLIENGRLPKDDFVIINKIQHCLDINLRADKQDFQHSPRSLIENNEDNSVKEQGFFDSDIKIIS